MGTGDKTFLANGVFGIETPTRLQTWLTGAHATVMEQKSKTRGH
jgi:hypothetical protein